MIKRLLVIFCCSLVLGLNAQKLFWVGGSGNWNDGQHWSLASGGAPSGKTPGPSNDLIIDDKSAASEFIINLVGTNHARSLRCLNEELSVYLNGLSSSNLRVSNDFILNQKTHFTASTNLIFSNNSQQQGEVILSTNILQGDVLFEDGKWLVRSMSLLDKNTLTFVKGEYDLGRSTIVAGNIIANSGGVKMSSQRGIMQGKNRFELGPNVKFLGEEPTLIGQKNNPNFFRIHPSITQGTNARVINNTAASCNVTYTYTNPSCFGLCDGSIILNFDVNCTTGPYTVNFQALTATCTIPGTVTGVSPPTYTLGGLCGCGGAQLDFQVYDAGGLVYFNPSGLPLPATPNKVNMNGTNVTMPSCFGMCNGAVSFNFSGGSGPYSYTCNPPGSSASGIPPFTTTTVSALCAGSHTFILQDSKACQVTSVVAISQPPVISPNGSSSSITCNGSANGSAAVSPTGGTPGYTINWSNGATTPTVGPLGPGVITASVTDSKGCVQTYSTNITQPTAITVVPSQTNVSCGGGSDGSALVNVSGGMPGYTYSWSPGSPPGQGTQQVTGLTAGTYTVVVKDINLCPKTQTFNITQPPPITLTPTFTNITCNGLCNGSAAGNPTGGTAPFSFTWTAPGNIVIGNSPTVSGLCPGVYTVNVKDNLACTKQATVQITQPPPITLTVNSTSVTCNGLCDGTASVTATGGSGVFNYTWTPGGFNAPGITNLCAGTYTIRVQDQPNKCPASGTVTIIQPPPILQNVTSVSVTCSGLCNGSINSTPSGGTAPYSSTLTSSSATLTTPPPYTNLCAGVYTLTTRDASGCSTSNTVNLIAPNTLTISATTTSISCFGDCNASLSGSILGGNAPYTYTWTTSTGTLSTPVITNQCAGSYTFTVKDVNGCNTSTVVSVASPPDMTVNITPTPPTCNSSCNGALTATVSGGTPGYTYNWSSPGSGSNIMGSLCAGNYTLSVNDAKGCIKTVTAALVAPLPIAISTTIVPTSCAGTCDGQITAQASGGTPGPGYTYQFNTLPVTTNTTGVVGGLCSANYVVTVTDSKGCTGSANVFIVSPPLLSAAITGVKPSCNVCIGAATVTPSGGTPGYTYSWTPTSYTTPVASNLCVGDYTVMVKDSKGCSATTTVHIAQTVILVITTNGSTLSCNGGCTGIATANASGGVAPYGYTWSTLPVPQTAPSATALCSGTYSVNVTDALGCSNTGTISFVDPPPILVTSTVTNASCNSQCNGAISVTASGGTGAITYSWSPSPPIGQGTPNVSNLCAGTYTLNVKDANGCPIVQTFTVTEPMAIASTFTANSPSTCSGTNGSILSNVTGGTAPYNYTWTPGSIFTPTIGGIGAGTYSLIVKDQAGCTTTLVATLSDPTGPTVTVTSNSILCNGSCSGSATVSATGTAPLTYLWSAPISSTNTTVSGICQGTYAVNVTDGSMCTTSKTLTITQPPPFTVNGTPSNPKCSSVCDGSVIVVPTGGTPAYSFTWNPGPVFTPNLTNVCAGTYTSIVKDANNCTYTNTFTLVSPSTITVNFTKADVTCNGVCTGTVKATASGGTGPYTYTWTPVGTFPGAPIDNIVNLCANVYTVTATDANGCSATATVQITEPPALSNTLTVRNARCNGQCNGSASYVIMGGTPTYAYSWSGSGVTTPTINSLCAGNYTATVTDGNGCVMSRSFAITQPAPLTVTVTPFNPTCNGVCNGSITSSASGGTGAYTYSWIPMGSGPNASGLCSGNYTLIVTDDSLCTGQNVTSLTNPPKLLANVSFTNPSCNSNCNGVAISTPSNATAPLSFTWTNSVPTVVSNNASATSLCAGMYTVIVKDNKGCRDTQQVSLVSPPSLTINPSVASAACGVCNGSITATAIGGTSPYTYSWTAPAISTTNVATNLCAGIYTLSITDANSCSNIFTIPLSNSNGPNGATVSFTDVTCNGLCNGAASITNPTGGTAPYNITWVTPSSTLNPISGLCAGTYTAQIKDNLNCVLFESVVINEPMPLIANTTTNLPICNGICNGSIVTVPSGGNPSYTFSWSTGSTNTGTTSSITNLCTGSYTLNITDTKGCALTQTFSMPGSSSITGSTVSINNKCPGSCNGSILAAGIAGGLPPYTFNWSDPLGQTTQQATGLCNGPYFVIVKDFNGCYDTLKSSITSPAPITLTTSVVQPTCGLCNGSSTVAALGGTAPFTYSWSSGPTGPSASNLCAGLYMVSITDGNGCAQNVSVTINNSSSLTGTVSSTNETCFGLCNGTASVTASGGTPPVTYNWVSPAASTNTLTGLCGGVYYVQIKDSKNCITTTSVNISAATSLTVTPFVMQPGCGMSNGTITANVTGGTGPISYNWMPGGGTTATLTNVSAGTYTLTVTRGGCSKTNVFTITNQNAQTIDLSAVNASCSGTCNAVATVSVTSGTGPYTFNWSGGTAASSSSMSTSSNLCSGVVIVTVTSTGNGCIVTESISISQPPPLVNSLPIVTLPKCHNDCNGAIEVVASGGTLPYAYSWNPSGSTNPLTNLCAGTYSASVTDANGCTSVTSYTIINPPVFLLAANVSNASCNTIPDGAITTTVSGGIPAYSYTWTGPAAFSSTAASLPTILPGTYSLSVTDFAGCRKDTSMLVISTITVIANAGNDTTFCQSGNFTLNGTASTGATAYQWFQLPNPAAISNSVTTVVTPPVGTTTFVLLASNGVCMDRDTMKLTSNPVPIVDAGPDYTISIYSSTGIGGSPTAPAGSTFSWSPSATLDSPTISNPVASNTVNTTYTVMIVDANGCPGSDTMHVFIYPQITIPNGFSPNGDGKNDTWMLDNIQQFPDCTVEIYSRWGEPLFFSKGYATNFDGRYKGKELAVGTYYYIINLNHPAFPKAYTGPLTIFR